MMGARWWYWTAYHTACWTKSSAPGRRKKKIIAGAWLRKGKCTDPYAKLDEAVANGKAMHKEIEYILRRALVPAHAPDPLTTTAELRGRFTVVGVELASMDFEDQLAGTVDLVVAPLAQQGGQLDVVLFDWKSGHAFNDRYREQLRQYAVLATANAMRVVGAYVVNVEREGGEVPFKLHKVDV